MINLKKIFVVFCVLMGTACTNNSSKPHVQTIRYEDEKFERIEEQEIKAGTREVSIDKKKLTEDKKAYVLGENEMFTGIFSQRYAGHLLYFEEYKDGILDGDKVWFGTDGTVGMREEYKNGKRNGDQITYHINGNVRSITPYVNGKIDGVVEWYDTDGLLIGENRIKNGTGRFVKYFENGLLQEEGQYRNHVKVGEWKRYNRDKELEKVVTYSKTGRVLKTRWYN